MNFNTGWRGEEKFAKSEANFPAKIAKQFLDARSNRRLNSLFSFLQAFRRALARADANYSKMTVISRLIVAHALHQAKGVKRNRFAALLLKMCFHVSLINQTLFFCARALFGPRRPSG